jgi:heme-degrading monooxygenase HmoA
MKYHLAQINVARFRVPYEDPANADFAAALDRVNALAEAQPGFVWRLVGEGNDATDIRPFEDPRMLVNMSVWSDLDALAAFVYRAPGHRDIMRRRQEWFERLDFYMALWWVPEGHIPSVAEGLARLDALTRLGPTPEAFLFNRPFPAPGAASVLPVLDACA